ncbi:MAG: mechanosensitive ion channel domain-containing protein [Planctomycetota bacterium]
MRISLASEEAARVRSEFAALRQRYAAVQQRLASSGLDRATGLLLRREFESLPDLVAIERRLRDTEEELAEIEFTLFERQDARAGSDDISRARETLLASVAGTEASAADVQAVATELVTARRDVLAELESDADRYQDVLLTLARDAEQLFQATSAYESFIRERILWVRSIPADRLALVEDTQTAITLIADRQTWRDGLQRIWTDIRNRFPTTIFAVATLVLTFATGRVCKRRLKANADQVSRFRTDHFGLTLRALGYTTVASLPGAATVWWLGWVLARPADQVDLLLSLGHGLQAAAFLLFVLRFTYHGCRVDGLGGAHFRWPAVGMRFVRAHLRWYVPVAVVAAVAVLALDRLGDESAKASVSRIVFTGAMLASAVLLQRLVRPHGPLASAWLGQRRDGWVDRLRVVWYPAIVAVPVALAVLSWLGFHYTALQLEGRIEATIAIVLLLLLINGLLVRWLFLARRRVAVEDARRRREQAMAAQIEGSAKDDDAPTEATLPPIDEDKLDLPNISMQTRQLFRTALAIGAVLSLYAVWADVLPALRMLEQVEVYPNQRLVEVDAANTIPLLETTPVTESQPASTDANVGSATTAASPSSSALPLPLPSAAPSDETTASSVISVTLADVGLAAVALLATFIAFRNLPGLIEIVVLQRLPLDAGSRYALSMVLKYLIAIIGVAAAFSAVNLAWSNIQWLAAALTFGLAFGLQEIFANFISGLIILAERPIRIGDTVTVGSVNGTVTRIRMRATTITDWDRKELIIPNKNFITGDVINWTLSDPLLRLIIPVGVSYSGDARKAEEILLGVASRAKNVLEDPKPFVVFNGFGDSTLNFELRVFIPHVNHIISVRHELHMLILEEFRKADIEIAFPQRDLHIRSIGDLKDVLIAKEQPELAGVRVDD